MRSAPARPRPPRWRARACQRRRHAGDVAPRLGSPSVGAARASRASSHRPPEVGPAGDPPSNRSPGRRRPRRRRRRPRRSLPSASRALASGGPPSRRRSWRNRCGRGAAARAPDGAGAALSLVPLSVVPRSLVPLPLIPRALVPAALVPRPSIVAAVFLAARLLAGRRLQRRHGAGAVLHDPFERARAPLVEIEPARHRLEPHLQALHLDAGARELDDEVVDHLVVERVELLAPRVARGVALVQIRLDVQRLDQRVGVEEQLEERPEQRPQPADRAAVRLVQGVFAERVVRRRRLRRADPAVLLEQVRAHALRVDELLELDVRQLADLFFGVVHAALLADARADLPHDLLDVDVVGPYGEIRH